MKSSEKYGIIISVIVLLVGSVFYFTFTPSYVMGDNARDTEDTTGRVEGGTSVVDVRSTVVEVVDIKVAYTSGKGIKLFALAKNNELVKLKAEQGNPIPEIGSMVIGNAEAETMKKEAFFSEAGDRIKDFFGVDVKIEGILQKTDSPLDELHFLTKEEFLQINGENNRVYVKYVGENLKLFYYYPTYGSVPIRFDLAEGALEDYTTHSLVGELYYPLILGSREAKSMRENKLFSKPGDIITDFFGKKMIIVGVLKETNTPMDMMYFVPIIKQEF
ncbi:hypothetical protein HYX11_05210 [Candidatus Woesearchaeota archaeon]|nr:hypothetical protein [Candidatus Woesearchaeota archaeon]